MGNRVFSLKPREITAVVIYDIADVWGPESAVRRSTSRWCDAPASGVPRTPVPLERNSRVAEEDSGVASRLTRRRPSLPASRPCEQFGVEVEGTRIPLWTFPLDGSPSVLRNSDERSNGTGRDETRRNGSRRDFRETATCSLRESPRQLTQQTLAAIGLFSVTAPPHTYASSLLPSIARVVRRSSFTERAISLQGSRALGPRFAQG